MIENFNHQPVLIKEVIESLAIIKSGNYIDATYGRGGHSEYILKHLGVKGKLLAIDKDLSSGDLKIYSIKIYYKNKKYVTQNINSYLESINNEISMDSIYSLNNFFEEIFKQIN